jgi:hypothetical protein
LPQEAEDLTSILDAIFQCFAIDQDVMKVCRNGDIEVWVKGFVNVSFECQRCIRESTAHDQELKEAILGTYRGLPDILISYPNEAIGITDVNFGNVHHIQ